MALNIAEVLSDQGRSDEAGPVFYESIDARRAVGIPLEIAEALSLLGRHEARVGKFTNAHACLDEARSLYQEHGDEFGHLATEARLVAALANSRWSKGLTFEDRAIAGAFSLPWTCCKISRGWS